MRYFLAFLFLLIPVMATLQDRVVSNTYLTGDNAYQYSFRQYAGYEKRLVFHPKDTTKPDRLLSIAPTIGWRCYFYDGLENHYTDLRTGISYRHSVSMNAGFNASVISSKEWSPFFFDGFIRYSRRRMAYELYMERDLVGTPQTNILRYVSSFTGLSSDFRISRRFTLVNSLAYNSISDGNKRWFQTMRFIYALKDTRSYVDFKIRKMYGGEWSPYYFSPSYISQMNVGYGFFSQKKKFSAKFYIGAGFQEIDNYYMAMFNTDFKIVTNRKNKWNYDIMIGSRNFNEYLYNTFTIKAYYIFESKKVSDK
jgi:hypothetical protein